MKISISLYFLVIVVGLSAQSTHTYSVVQNVEWAKPGGHSLTMDIYTPQTGKTNYPVYVIFHGGGWLINNETIMDQMSAYMAEHGEYVICNVNYRLLPMNNNTITLNQMVEDVFGAVLWIKENIGKYKGDAKKIAVSGDSAGGHLSEMIVVCGTRLESDGYAGSSLGFNPTYLPKGKTAEQIAQENGLEVQAAVLNYPAIDFYKAALGDGTNGFESNSNFFWSMGGAKARGVFGDQVNVKNNPNHYKAVSPNYFVPKAAERKLPPQLVTVGTKDNLTTPASVQEYVRQLKEAGQPVEYWEHKDRPHAYLDSGSNQYLGISFEKDAPEAIDKIISWLDSVFGK